MPRLLQGSAEKPRKCARALQRILEVSGRMGEG